MSVMVLSEPQVAVIVRVASDMGYIIEGMQQHVFAKLMWMNQRAWEARYGEWMARDSVAVPPEFRVDYRKVATLVRCYRYNSCDAPEWPCSYAELLTDMVYRDLIRQYGHTDGPWTIDTWDQVEAGETVEVEPAFF